MSAVMSLRDELAHGKPNVQTIDKELTVTREELFDLGWTKTGWEESLTLEHLNRYRGDMNALWKEMLDASGLEVFDTLTRSSSSTQFIEHVPVKTVVG